MTNLHTQAMQKLIDRLEADNDRLRDELAARPVAELADLTTYPSPHGTLVRLADVQCRVLAVSSPVADAGEYTPEYRTITDHNGRVTGVHWVNADKARPVSSRADPSARTLSDGDIHELMSKHVDCSYTEGLAFARAILAATSTPAEAPRILSTAEIDDMCFGYAPSGKIGELRELVKAVLAATSAKEV